ncbi:UDP-3-O-(3-hydroxymyristoyl)glucosamine N-acyltransferase [Neptuniibacter sp.]|uniref:UDP-3-O-(3-hydroxymyristoyl)glucosamine N-acyltransferase n=1 Tax=Neptuniibacter sp. TaxID=1962643 RepID=UPI0026337D6B|nr:UDP-3-O-(3-hydroxymyristoyl)glucosamine N-acyltransferase [Neptuniibacter sp.]MCP4596034.1 UDP-3-O-(3-hydroxymyristoyl)glucosamine N-acyltransferase [Neptuniibacter sp.]
MSRQEYSLIELAEIIAADIQGDANYRVSSIGTLQSASSEQLTFIANPKYQKYLPTTQAGAVILSEQDLSYFSGNALITANPYLAYARLSQLFARDVLLSAGISPSAEVHPSAQISGSATVAAGVIISEDVRIADNVVVGPNTVIGAGCIVGENSLLQANVTLYPDVHIGKECLVHSGAVLGADGFGFANESGKWVKIAQLGGVRIGDNVEIGACTTIDRGALDNTEIGNGVILDNQIQIAHNVQIGEHSAIAGCTAVAGSTKIGANCTIAGACGITGHLEIAAGTHITAMSLVTKSIKEPGAYSSGTGMLPTKEWKKSVVRFRQLDDLSRRLKSLEEKVLKSKGS